MLHSNVVTGDGPHILSWFHKVICPDSVDICYVSALCDICKVMKLPKNRLLRINFSCETIYMPIKYGLFGNKKE